MALHGLFWKWRKGGCLVNAYGLLLRAGQKAVQVTVSSQRISFVIFVGQLYVHRIAEAGPKQFSKVATPAWSIDPGTQQNVARIHTITAMKVTMRRKGVNGYPSIERIDVRWNFFEVFEDKCLFSWESEENAEVGGSYPSQVLICESVEFLLGWMMVFSKGDDAKLEMWGRRCRGHPFELEK